MLKGDKITKKELVDKLANLPDDAEIHFLVWDFEELNGRIRQYSMCLESITISVYEGYASISLNGKNHYKDE